MVNNVLVILGSAVSDQTTLIYAKRLAQSLEAKLSLLKLVTRSSTRHVDIVDPIAWRMKRVEVEADLTQAINEARSSGLSVEGMVLENPTAIDLVAHIREHGADLVVVAEEHTVLSPSTFDLFTHLQTPMLMIRTNADPRIIAKEGGPKRIVIPLDGSQRAEYVLPLAAQLAERWGATLLLLHVIHKPEMPRRAVLTEEDATLINHIVERNRESLSQYFDQLARSLGANIQIEGHLVVSDNVTRALHEFVEEERADLIALSAHGYSGEPRWPYGSVASNLMAFCQIPLLIVQDFPRDLNTDQPPATSESRRDVNKT